MWPLPPRYWTSGTVKRNPETPEKNNWFTLSLQTVAPHFITFSTKPAECDPFPLVPGPGNSKKKPRNPEKNSSSHCFYVHTVTPQLLTLRTFAPQSVTAPRSTWPPRTAPCTSPSPRWTGMSTAGRGAPTSTTPRRCSVRGWCVPRPPTSSSPCSSSSTRSKIMILWPWVLSGICWCCTVIFPINFLYFSCYLCPLVV